MKPAPFEYLAPTAIPETVSALDEHGFDAKLLAGGQSLTPTMNFRLAQPAILIDINRVPELAGISRAPSGVTRIGAMTRQRAIERSPAIAAEQPLLAEAIPFVAHPQIRNRGTIGGSIVHADPAAELPVVAVALRATLNIASASGTRQTAATDFYRGVFDIDLQPEELLTSIDFPAWQPEDGYAFVEVARRHGDYALAGVAAVVGLDQEGNCRHCRLVYLSLGDKPIVAEKAAQALIGQPPTDDHIKDTAHIASADEIEPAGNIHASPAYQRHLANVLTQRALAKAFERATPA